MTPPLPVTTVGGYLGAGKTTLINHLLRNADGIRLAVLVNEFGELAIDEDLIEAEDGNVISIAGGCICCAFGDNLLGALMNLAQLSPPPDHILIEASGVAIPGSVAASLSLLSAFRQDGIVVLADAETVQSRAEDRYVGDTILRQLADADLIVLTKTDLISDQARVTDWLAGLAPGADVIPTRHGQVPPGVILGPLFGGRALVASPHSDNDYESLTLEFNASVDPHTLARTLAAGGLGVIRAKGQVTAPDGETWLIQVVGQRFEVTPAAGTSGSRIVCIGLTGKLKRSPLRALSRPAD